MLEHPFRIQEHDAIIGLHSNNYPDPSKVGSSSSFSKISLLLGDEVHTTPSAGRDERKYTLIRGTVVENNIYSLIHMNTNKMSI